MQTITIACEGAKSIALEHLEHFQGDLKDLSQENYERLKREILERGFSEPISVWRHKGKLWILNGHQRVRTLRAMQDDGYVIPPLPVSIIHAKDEQEARLKVLALTSQYGEMTRQGLYEFMETGGVAIDQVVSSFRFPEIDFPKFMAEFYVEPAAKPTDTFRAKTGPNEVYALGKIRLVCGPKRSGSTAELIDFWMKRSGNVAYRLEGGQDDGERTPWPEVKAGQRADRKKVRKKRTPPASE